MLTSRHASVRRLRALALAGALLVLVPGAARALSAGPSQTFAVEADAYVSPPPPSKLYGAATSLKVDAAPSTAYLRFSVSGLSNPVAKATLRLYSLKANGAGIAVHPVADTSWNESTLAYAGAPAVGATSLPSGALPNDGWVALDVTSLVQANGTYSFALTSASNQSAALASRERASATAAQLVVDEAAAVPADTSAPTAPMGVVSTGATGTTISLAWSASIDNVGVAGYRVYRGTSLLGSTSGTSFTANGLSCGTSYTLGVEAYDAAGNTSARTSINASTVRCPDTAAPTAPGTPSATTTTATSIALAWAASTDNVGVAGYRVFENGTQIATTPQTSYSAGSLTCATSYTFGVEAYDAAGNTSARSSAQLTTGACPDTSPPTAPTTPAASSIGATSITLSWGASLDNVGVAGYSLYRNGSLVSSTSATVYTFTGLTCGTSYSLAVDAYDAAGNRSAKSSVTAATSSCPDTVAPSTPTSLALTGTTTSSISVSWAAATDNVAVTGYSLYLNGTRVTSTTSTSHTYSSLTCGTSYTVGVEAFDAAGNVSGRATLTAATATCPPPPTSGGPCGTTSTPPSTWQHVVWIVMENKQYGEIIGSSNAPYINGLAKQCGSASSMYAESHPSLPNYIAMTSGSTQGITDDNGPSSHPLSVPSIFSQLGSGWKSLEESMPSNCYLSNSGNYAVRHNPAAYFTNISGQCATQDVPLTSTPDISARFTFVTPNVCSDMHSCPTQSDIATEVKTGDTWLSSFIPKLTSTAQYQAGNTVIFLTWDEDDGGSSNANHIATLVISPSTPAGLLVTSRYDHYSMLRTTEELLGLSLIGNAASASSMATAFHLR